MTFLLGATGASGIPMYYFQLVYVVGFIAAVVIGSIAWYNSKRPAGWEEEARPDFIPNVKAPGDKGETPEE